MSIATRYGNTAASGALARAAAIAASLMLGACAQMGSIGSEIADAGPAADGKPKLAASQGDLQKALEYWSKEHEKAPRELKPALAYARNLKAAGQQERALGVLQHASMFHSHDRELLSDYGRLALDADQLSLAQKLLEAADDPGKPDWRILSGLGVASSAQGRHEEAQRVLRGGQGSGIEPEQDP